MDYLALNNFDFCFKLLKNSEKILSNENLEINPESKKKLLSLTFNNLGCYYKKKEKPNVALNYLMSSLEIEMKDPKTEQLNLAGTHLNLTAILTKLSKHKEAIKHAKSAINILEKLIGEKEKQSQDQKRVSFDEKTNYKDYQERSQLPTVKEQNTDRIVAGQHIKEDNNLYLTEAIAYYNLGASYEHLAKMQQAIRAYQIAKQIAKIHLGEMHPLSQTIGQNLIKAEEKDKFSSTSRMLRSYLRKEKATTNFFKSDIVSQMSKRLSLHRKLNSTVIQEGRESLPSPPEKPFSYRNKKRGASMQNSRKPLTRLNQTQINSINNSLVNLNTSVGTPKIVSNASMINKDLTEIVNQNDTDYILAMSKEDENIFSNQSLKQHVNSSSNNRYKGVKKRFMSIDLQKQTETAYSGSQNDGTIASFNQAQQKRIYSIKKPHTANIPNREERFLNSSQRFNRYQNNESVIEQYKPHAEKFIAVKRLLHQDPQGRRRVPIDVSAMIAEQNQYLNFNNLPHETSLTRLNKRLNTLETQVASKVQQQQ